MRGDRGGENVGVSTWMIMHRGANRASFMWGSSTRNTRIERLWVEVGKQFARRWRAFFTRLGELHRLDRKNPNHLWLLHVLFLSDINEDCDLFTDEWNHHPLGGPETSDRSPLVSRVTNVPYGVYAEDPYIDVHPSVLVQYLGTYGHAAVHAANQTGAGHPEDEAVDEDALLEQLENTVVDHVARARSPFHAPADEVQFREVLQAAQEEEYIPDGYGITPQEWETGEYPDREVLRIGARGVSLTVDLPMDIWYPRALMWVQGLDVLTRMLEADLN
ncbi:hypothetical protein BC629DRAFT_1585879 [Irpex lacteus]|nr:hypothetical protein BC629DRAFT_1585879 [Irpex lacteus]